MPPPLPGAAEARDGRRRGMALGGEFRKKTEDLVDETLALYRKAGASPRIARVWDAQRPGDFLCGFFVGEMVGSALGAFQAFHRREPTPEEHVEIVEIVESRAGAIREFFARFNPPGGGGGGGGSAQPGP